MRQVKTNFRLQKSRICENRNSGPWTGEHRQEPRRSHLLAGSACYSSHTLARVGSSRCEFAPEAPHSNEEAYRNDVKAERERLTVSLEAEEKTRVPAGEQVHPIAQQGD